MVLSRLYRRCSRAMTTCMVIALMITYVCLYIDKQTMTIDSIMARSVEDIHIHNKHHPARKYMPFRLRQEYIMFNASENTTYRTPQSDTVSSIINVKVAELNRTKEDVYKIHTDLWKRPADYTDLPIPSYDARYLMNTKPCSDDKPPLFLIIVQTAPKHYLTRNVIRESWGNKRVLETQTMHVIFLLGEVVSNVDEKALQQEQDLHGDLVQGAFIDSYRNLTHKSVLGLRWATEYCRQAKYVLRVDDDVFVNMFRLIELSRSRFRGERRHIWCTVKDPSPILRNVKSKWTIDKDEFKGFKSYPMPYCNGPFSVTTSDIIPELFEASKITPLFWIEDTYMSGMLRYVVGNVSLVDINQYFLQQRQRYNGTIRCFTKQFKCDLVVMYPFSLDQIWNSWKNCLLHYRKIAAYVIENNFPLIG